MNFYNEREWTPGLPDKPGRYWWYGKRFGSDDRDNELFELRVWGETADGHLAYVCQNAFMYEEQAIGHYIEAHLPELPKEEN